MTKPKLIPIGIVPDAHVPFEDKRAWALMMKVFGVVKPKLLVVIGDLADCCAISDHDKDPERTVGLAGEVAAVNARLDELDALGATDKIFVSGNHCDRLSRYLQRKAPELFDLTDIPSLFHLKERKWQYVPYRKHTKRGKLYFTHDVGVSGRYAVYRCLEAYEHSVVTGHTHRLAYIVEGNAIGTAKVSAQFGWLGDRTKIDYMSEVKVVKDWALGFGVGYMDPSSGLAYLTPVPIVNYTACVNGRLYQG